MKVLLTHTFCPADGIKSYKVQSDGKLQGESEGGGKKVEIKREGKKERGAMDREQERDKR